MFAVYESLYLFYQTIAVKSPKISLKMYDVLQARAEDY